MYPISNAVKALFDAGERQTLRVTGTDKNNTPVSITDADVVVGGFGVDRYCCNGEKLEVGTAIVGQMTLKLNNSDGRFNDIVFEGTELFVEIGIADWSQSSPTVNWVPCGRFTPDVQPRRLNQIELTCFDRMTKFDEVVNGTQLTFPTTVAGLVGQVDALCGVTLAASISNLPNAGVSIAGLPTGDGEMTYRDLIRWCAGIMATNAWIDWNGQLRFTWYNNSTGYEMTVANRFDSDLYENDLTVTGAVYTNASGIEIVEGTDDYAIDLTGNALAGPIIATVLPVVASAVSGFVYRPFTATVVNAPYLWPMDVVTFEDRDGNDHTSVLTNVAFGINGNTALESRGMTYALNRRAQPKGVTKEQAQLISEAMERVETDIDDSLTQQEIFNRLTDNGAAQGLILYNGQLYVNASYINAGYLNANRIQGGTLTLGGDGNINGLLSVLNADDTAGVTIDNAGITINNDNNTMTSKGYWSHYTYLTPYYPGSYVGDVLRSNYDESSTERRNAYFAPIEIGLERTVNNDTYNSAAFSLNGVNVQEFERQPDQSLQSVRQFLVDLYGHRMLFTGNAVINGALNVGSVEVKATWPSVLLYANSGTQETGAITSHRDNGRVYVTEHSTDGTKEEYYQLPIADGNGTYNILTTKSAVGVPQGGTGATDAAGARTNLGVTPANIGAMPVNPASIELKPASGTTHGGFIDFHYGGSSADYTTRLMENADGVLSIKTASDNAYYPILTTKAAPTLISASVAVAASISLNLSAYTHIECDFSGAGNMGHFVLREKDKWYYLSFLGENAATSTNFSMYGIKAKYTNSGITVDYCGFKNMSTGAWNDRIGNAGYLLRNIYGYKD